MSKKYIEKLLAENEMIIMETRQHWSVFFREILPELAMIIAIILLTTLSWQVWWGIPNIALAYLLIILPTISLVKDLLTWLNHQYFVTNRRVIQVFGILTKNVTDSSLDKVNDVKMVQSFWGRMLNFGTIEILTASEYGVNRFTNLDKPIDLKTAMLNAKESMGTRPAKFEQQAYLDKLFETGAITENQVQEIQSSWSKKKKSNQD